MPTIPPVTKIEDGLYLGDSLCLRDQRLFQEHNIGAVVSITHVKRFFQDWYLEIISDDHHLHIPANDSMTQDILPYFTSTCDFIHKNRASCSVLIHCEKGISRSATLMVAYLMRTHKLGRDRALDLVKEMRKVKPNDNFMEQLAVWEAEGYIIWTDSTCQTPKTEYAAYLSRRAERLKEAGLTGNEPIGIQSL
jgi:protein-tyrosine phosphatase